MTANTKQQGTFPDTLPGPIDLSEETLIGLPAAARRLPPFRAGRPVSPATVWRWISEGVRLPDGHRVRLEAIRLGGRWLTSVEAIQRFAVRQTPQIEDRPSAPRPPVTRQWAADRAARELDKLGI